MFGRYSVVPGERDHAAVSAAIGTGAAILFAGVPAIMSLLHLGGVF